jgi:hypothetical protein
VSDGDLRDDVLRAAALVEAVARYDPIVADRAIEGGDAEAMLRLVAGWLGGALRALAGDDPDEAAAVMAGLRSAAYADGGGDYDDGPGDAVSPRLS